MTSSSSLAPSTSTRKTREHAAGRVEVDIRAIPKSPDTVGLTQVLQGMSPADVAQQFTEFAQLMQLAGKEQSAQSLLAMAAQVQRTGQVPAGALEQMMAQVAALPRFDRLV